MRKLFINMDIKNEHIGLKPVEMTDVKDVYEYASNPKVKMYIGWNLMNSLEETEELIKVLQAKDEANTHAHASVVELISGKVVGTIIIFGADNDANHCEIGYVLSESCWNKGYGTDFVNHLCNCAFDDLGYDKIFARVCSENIGSQKVLINNGFEIEAVVKDYYFIEGVKQDLIYLSKKR